MKQNRFVAVNQFTISGSKQPRRPDVICFINGIPFAVLELKSPGDENADIWDAFNQLQTYKDEIPDLFVFNEALVVSDGYTARVGSLTANQERFLPWRTIKHEDDKPLLEWQLETLVCGFFDRELFLDYLRFFVLFESDGETIIKKIAGYHQFHAVRAEEAYAVLAEKMDAIRGLFAKTPQAEGLDISGYETQAHKLLVPAANYVLSLKDGKKRFLD
ncbi:MAG: type I restriction endonuclease, partial [Methylobacter sp.]